MSSTGKGRLYRSARFPTLRGRIGLPDVVSAGRVLANDTWWGGYPPPPTEIPYAWLTPPARWRSDQPRNVAAVSRTNGATARATDAASVAAVGERPFTATLDTAVVDDPANCADWIVGNYTQPRQRMPQLKLNLRSRTPTECWRILEREIGDRISISGAPGSSVQLVANPWFESLAGWTASGCSISQSTAWSRSGASSLLITPDGVSANAFALDDLRTVTPGAAYVIDGWLFSPGGYSSVGISVNWYTAAGAYITTSSATSSIGANFTSHRTHTFTAPATAAFGRVHPVLTGTPAPSNTLHADDVTMTGPDGAREPWPTGVTELVIEGIQHSIDAEGTRWVVWNTAPLIGAAPGQAGPWFRADESRTDIGSDLLTF